MGQRISKTVTNKNVTMGDKFVTTYYVRDPQGNVLAVYEHKHGDSDNGTFTLAEQHLYGASRLGMRKRDLALNVANASESTPTVTHYELTNHLGNVMAVISDEASDTNEPTVVSLSDYYPFGMTEPGRSWNERDYRYGFNGKENFSNGNDYNYGFRIYNSQICKFLSVDPLSKSYPWYSPYQFAGNIPILYVDLDGLEPSENPEDPRNQDGRNVLWTIDKVYKYSKEYYVDGYVRGSYDSEAYINNYCREGSTIGDDGIDYVGVNPNAKESNEFVSRQGIFKIDDSKNSFFPSICASLLKDFVTGTGFENVEFPCNGPTSNSLRTSHMVRDALSKFKEMNFCDMRRGKDPMGISMLCTGGDLYAENGISIITHFTFYNPETFIGSAFVSITPIKDNSEVLVEIFNVTSITSGDLMKHSPWNSYPKSCVRDPNKITPYGNISQSYSFTMSMEDAIGIVAWKDYQKRKKECE